MRVDQPAQAARAVAGAGAASNSQLMEQEEWWYRADVKLRQLVESH